MGDLTRQLARTSVPCPGMSGRTNEACPGGFEISLNPYSGNGYSPDKDKMSGHVRHVRVGVIYPPFRGVYAPHGVFGVRQVTS